ncbi:uncharacterized protein LOC116419305 [Sarcophilus harrisii]|uniref:uncharacterized protein LOC116419305 n=1 Tax=Sarcophilus harrisii TaxID=9305 RepID=UPI001301B5D2|nr:uncharacterized protein LOC116419305 [Sarcophilus harrisii]
MKLQNDFPGKSLPRSQNQLPSKKSEKIPTLIGEPVVGIGSVIDYKVGVQLIKPVPQKMYSKDMKLQNDYPGKSVSQNQLASTRFGKIPSKGGEAVVGIEPIIDYKIGVQLEKPVPQKECSKDMNLQSDSPGKSLPLSQNQSPSPKSGNMPSQEDEVAAAGSEPVIDSKEGDHLEKPISQKQCEPFLDKEKQKEVKKDLKQELKLRGPSELPEASSSLASHLSDSVEKEKDNFLNVGDLKSFPGKREDSLENIFLQNLKINFPKNVLQFSSHMCSKKSTPQSKNKPKTEHTCSINEEKIAYVAKNIKKNNSKSGINERNEDSSFGIEMTFSQHKNITSLESDSDLLQSSDPGSYFGVASNNQEKMPELITSRKHKEKTKHIETSFQNSHHNATNSPNELEEKRQKHQQNKTETLERQDGEKTENRRAVKANEQFSVEHGKDEENKIPGEEIPLMSISSEEKLSPMHHILNGNWREKLMQKHRRNSYSLEKFEEKEIKIGENFKKPEDEKWISEDSSSTTCEKVNSSSSLLDSCDDSTLNETDSDELRLAKNVLNEKNKDKVEMATDALLMTSLRHTIQVLLAFRKITQFLQVTYQ